LSEDPVSESSVSVLADAVERLPQLLALQSELHIEMRTVVPDFADDPVLATYQLAESIGLQAIDAQRVLEAETADMRVTIVSDLLEETIELTRLQLGVR
jgi:hypothetical protein